MHGEKWDPRTGCPSRHPEHRAPCIAVGNHLGNHRDKHGCLWTSTVAGDVPLPEIRGRP